MFDATGFAVRRPHHTTLLRRLTMGVLTLIVGAAGAVVLGAVPAQAAADPAAPAVQQFSSRKVGTPFRAKQVPQPRNDAANLWKAPAVTWPAAGAADVQLAAEGVVRRAGTLPVSVAAGRAGQAGTVHVTVAGREHAQAAGVLGVVAALTSSDATLSGGPMTVTVDYGSWVGAYGADTGRRLRLAVMPACAATTPTVPACQVQTPIPTTNDSTTQTLTAQITLPTNAVGSTRIAHAAADGTATTASTLVLATQTATSSDSGDYTATPMQPSGTWSGGGNAGDFTYNYPIPVPPVPGNLTPDVNLAYDAQSVDGKMVSTNSQSSWIGDGWDYTPGYIEQSYVTCKDNPQGTAKNTSDNCWAGPVVHLNFSGNSGDLVYDSSLPTKWKVSNDGGAKVEQLTSAGINGTYDGDYWKVTTQDGTQFFFGLNHLPGWASGKTATNSAWTEPVYSPYSSDPCYSKTDHLCTMAWRWNLDYVIDAHHNAIAYYYTPETNYYGQNNATTGVIYTRGGVLDHADYGLVDPNPYTASASARVQFTTSERCIVSVSACAPGNITSTPSNWPDVPYADQNCNPGATCNVHAPTFWSRLRLTTLTTSIWNGTSYTSVDTYALTQKYPNPGDGTTPSLWLESIQHTGNAGTAITLPAVTFAGTNKPNRVDTTDLASAINHLRISQITTETGERILVYYTSQQCTAPVTITTSANTSLCYPVYWTPQGASSQKLDWFNKYVVTEIDEQDPVITSTPTVVTKYTYVGNPAWHFDDNEVTKAKYRTYGQWRGYPRVQTRVGGGSDPTTLTESYFYQGMNGDTLPSGSRTANVTLSPAVTWPTGGPATSVPDTNELAGKVRETITYNGDGGPVLSATATDYWVGPATATRNRTGLSAVTAKMNRTVATYTTTAITSGPSTAWRTTKTETTYDTTTGLPTVVYDHGDLADSSQATCATTTYAPANTDLNLVSLPAEVEIDAVACAGSGVNGLSKPTGLTAADIVSDQRNFYDVTSFVTTWPQTIIPTAGNRTVAQKASDFNGTFTYLTLTKTLYDSFGRPISVVDANDNPASTTQYTETNGLTTSIKTTNPLGQFTTTTVDPARGLNTKIIDQNSLEIDEGYDALGRLTGVWLPGNNTLTNPANKAFTYSISNTVPSTVTTKTLNENGSYRISVSLFDALLRVRQVQTQSPSGGRLIDDTYYDSHDWTIKATHQYYDSAAASTTFLDLTGQDQYMPNQDLYTYDGSGRQILDASTMLGIEQWRTRTVYGGDRTTVIPPVTVGRITGGTPITTIVDARGRTIEQDSYNSAPTVTGNQLSGGAYTKITYGYDRRGNQSTITDAGGNVWTSTFNLLGQVSDTVDPDAGSTHLTYDKNGNLATRRDSNNVTVSYAYDALNRKTFEYDGPTSASPKLAAWTYDSTTITNGIGKLATSTSYDGTYAYTTTIGGYTNRYALTSKSVTIPADPANGNGIATLANTYTFSYTYTPSSGLHKTTAFPATTGALPAETVNYTYNVMDMPNSMGNLSGDYVHSTTYNQYGLISQVQMGTNSVASYLTNVYEQHMLRLADTHVDHLTTRLDDVTYNYGPTGLITASTDTRNNNSATVETQCYDHNLLGQLTTAWTATDNCAADLGTDGATNATVGGINPYWTSWTYTNLGDRAKETQHAIPGQSTDTESTYAYPAVGTGQPNTLRAVTATGPNAQNSSYNYDTAGNMISRTTVANGSQTLTWNHRGQLAKVTDNPVTKTSTFVYDADGALLVQRDPGTVTVYLPEQQLTLNTATSAVTACRYYKLNGVTAVRTGTAAAAYNLEISNNNGSPTLLLDHNGATPTWRSFTPFGAPRDTAQPTWPDNHGFLDKPKDVATGLTIIGFRQYDPATGRFVSLDPVLDPTNPLSLNGYSYADNSPISKSDPTGAKAIDDGEVQYNPSSAGKKDNGSSGAHLVAVALRMERLREVFGANVEVSGDLLGNGPGPDLVCWNCSKLAGGPDVVWVWEVKSVKKAANLDKALESLTNGIRDATADPLARGRRAVAGPSFYLPSAGLNTDLESIVIVNSSEALRGLEVYTVIKPEDEPTPEEEEDYLETRRIAKRLNQGSDATRRYLRQHPKEGVTPAPFDEDPVTLAILTTIGGIGGGMTAGAEAGAAGAEVGIAAVCRSAPVLCSVK
ncbi:RHS repeat-associated core domain-containing protein [Hamadaea sp. NPDC050747]|uniref:RHS repeat domain-containing protein n=1 Tax=Hamadaea sp. NPDC050747 TaxID=3155789 RepID=UPI0033D41896